MTDLADDLAAIDAFRALTADDRRVLASLCGERSVAAGRRLLEQGEANSSLYILRSGGAAVRLRRGDRIETLARLSPPVVLGEISFLTGRPCSAAVDITVDATLAELPRDALNRAPDCRDRLVKGLALVLAERLHDANAGIATAVETPVVLLSQAAHWAAPSAFAAGLTAALAEERDGDALWLVLSPGRDAPLPQQSGERTWKASTGPAGDPVALRAALAHSLPRWCERFRAVVVSCEQADERLDDAIRSVVTHVGYLIGQGDAVPARASTGRCFVVQDARRPSLTELTATSRLIPDVVEAERARIDGRPVPHPFSRSVAAVARAILGTTFGLVLGAGGARGWAHIGVLEALARATLPIDAIAGSSMGAIVGGLVAQGIPISDLRRVIAEWPRRRRRLRELRLWRMHLARERGIEDLLRHFFGERRVSETEIPYAVNAVDIERGEEVVITRGLVRQATRASMAFPGWLPPFELDGRVLVDGATLNPVPVAACRALGADFTLAVNVLGPTAPRPLPTRWPSRQFEVMARTFQMSGYSMGRGDTDADVVIAPDLGDATMLSFDRYEEMVERGGRAAEARLPAIRAAYAERRAYQAGRLFAPQAAP